jgi:hypothetical protein
VVFPFTPLAIQVDISLDGITWTDITSDVRAADQIRISRGRSDWGQAVDAGRCTFSLGNTDGKYSPRNPEGVYYGQIGRNTPVRVSVESGAVAVVLPGNSGDFISTPDTGVLDITGDIDVRFDGTLANWVLSDNSGVRTELIGKSTLGQRSWSLYIRNGFLLLEWTTDGSTLLTMESTVTIPVPASGRLAVRATLDVNNGAAGRTATFYTSDSIDGVWNQLGTTVITAGTTSIFSGTAELRVGEATSLAWVEGIGYVHAAEVRSGIAGTVVANPNFSAQASGTTSFADSAGRTWTKQGNTEISNRKIRFVGEISSWTPRWETGGFDVVTDVEASGLLRRLGQGSVPAKSPMYREFTSATRSNIIAYWPMEDESNATTLASAVSGHPAFAITGSVTPGAYSTWTASAPLPTIGTGSLRVNMPTYTSTTDMFMRFFMEVPAAGVVSTQRVISFTTSGTARTWSLYCSTAGALELEAYDADGATVLNPGAVAFAVNGLKQSIGIELTQNGANIDWTLFVLDIDTSTLNTSAGSSVAGTLNANTFGRVTQIRLGEDGAMNGTAIGHLAVADDGDAFANTLGAIVGWNGEVAASRINRLGGEEGFHAYATRIGDEQMGVQSQSTILELLRQAEGVDEGILCEQRDLLGLRYVQRLSLHNQIPDLVLDYEGSDGLVTPLDPVEDDQALANDVTVQRDGGSSARQTLSSGALSTLAPPLGVGLYDVAHTLSLFSDMQPPLHAGWKLHLGTWDELRVPVVTVDLANSPDSIDDAASVDIGSRLQITHPPVWMPPDTLDLAVQGYSEVLSQFVWTLSYNCSPMGPYNVAFESDAAYDRADTDGSDLAEALTTTETAADVAVTAGPLWVTVPAPLNVNTSLDTDMTGWSAFGSTIERVPTPGIAKFIGLWSLKMTPDGVEQYPNAGSEQVAVTVGQNYTLTGWLRCATTRSVALNINWFNGGGYLSTSSNDNPVVKNEWTFFEVTATAPVGAVTANAAATVPDFPPVTDVLWCTHVMIRREGGSPEEFPFDLRVGGEVVRAIGIQSSVLDTYTRTASASTWGTPTVGTAWVNTGGVAGDHYTTGTEGAHRLTAVDVARLDLTAANGTDFDVTVDTGTAALATGGPQLTSVVARATDGDNLYMAQLSISTAAVITLTIRKRVATVETQLGTYTTTLTHTAFAFFRLRFQVIGSALKARVWSASGTDPVGWQIEVTDTALTTGSNVGCRSVRQTANTNANLVVQWDNFELLNPQTHTVIRSINGVTKTHSAGADLRLAYPAYTSL